MDKEWLETIFKRCDWERSVAKVLSVEYVPAVEKGENYSSIVLRAKFKLILSSGRECTRLAIIKKMIEIEEQAKLLEDWDVFKVETKMFTEVLYHVEKLMDEYHDRNDKLWGDLIGYNPYDTIVLQDLTEANYHVADRRESLDLAHALLVVKGLGRFHAMTKILLDRGIIARGDHFTNDSYFAIDCAYSRRLIKGGLKQASQVMASSWPPEWKETSERISSDVDGACLRLQALSKIPDGSFVVLNHGDCWISNLMFKYSVMDGTQPISVKFIDFQLCNYNSYAWDLVYFIYSSVKSEDRREHYDLLLKVYQESLEDTLLFYDYNGKYPSVDDVRNEMERLQYFSFIVLACVLPIVTADSNEPFNLNKLSVEKDYFRAYNPEIYNCEKYMASVTEEFRHFIEIGII